MKNRLFMRITDFAHAPIALVLGLVSQAMMWGSIAAGFVVVLLAMQIPTNLWWLLACAAACAVGFLLWNYPIKRLQQPHNSKYYKKQKAKKE